MIVKQKRSSSLAVHIYSVGDISSTFAHASSISLVVVLVEHEPFPVLVICPFAVAVDGGRCFVMSARVGPGNVVSSSGGVLLGHVGATKQVVITLLGDENLQLTLCYLSPMCAPYFWHVGAAWVLSLRFAW